MEGSSMRNNLLLLGLVAIGSAGCVIWPVLDVATRPLARKATFEEVQKGYCDDIRFGVYEDAVEVVEPALRGDFLAAQRGLRDIRFTGYRIDSIEIDPMRTQAQATVVYTGYWLSSPYEREIEVIQRWRLEVATRNWYVTPPLETMLDPPGSPDEVSMNETLL
jgi:hypothetical protein